MTSDGVSNWRDIAVRTAKDTLADNCLTMAAALAYNLFLALFPALLCVAAVASFFPLDVLIRLIGSSARFLPEGLELIVREQAVKLASGDSGGLLTMGFVLAVWSSSSAASAMIDSINLAHDLESKRSWIRQRLLAILITVVLTLFIMVSFSLVMTGPLMAHKILSEGAMSAAFDWAWTILRWPIAFALVASAFGIVYYIAPDEPRKGVRVVPGAVVATVLWFGASLLFKVYVATLGQYAETYGAIAGPIVALLWLYLSALSVLVGAELNAELEHGVRIRTRGRALNPGARLPARGSVTKGASHVAAGSSRRKGTREVHP
jgi:membrane protein